MSIRRTPGLLLALLLALCAGPTLNPIAPAYAQGAVQGVATRVILLPALGNNSVWENFKRIKQQETTLEEQESKAGGEKPEKPASARKKPPAAKAAKAPPQASSVASGKKKRAVTSQAVVGVPDQSLISAPREPTEEGNWWAFYRGKMDIDANSFYDPHGIDFEWAYARKKSLPKNPRVVVYMHGSGGGKGSVLWAFGPSPKGDIEVRAQDAETYDQYWREWWSYSKDGQPYPGRRIAAILQFVKERYDLDVSINGIVLEGPSMGGAGAVVQTMILPSPWRSAIAYSSGRVGIVMPRRVAQKSPGQYDTLPPDDRTNRALWNSIDFSIAAASDPVVRGIHYRHSFSSNDVFSAGPDGNTQTEFVNLIEQYKIGGAFAWVRAGHGTHEPGVKLPDLANFEAKMQDITLDRAHPAFTRSTGNHPLSAAERINEQQYPRGHYNMGLIWDHAAIVDKKNQLIFPLKYNRRTGMGKGIPDQPEKITVSVTPRRPKNFDLRDGEVLKWSFNGGALSGTATVAGDTVTIDDIPLIAGDAFRKLRIYR